MLDKLKECKSLEEALMVLMTFDNALSYNKRTLMKRYIKGVTEEKALGLDLCGTSGCSLVIAFIEGRYLEQFLENVSFNAKESVPLIMRVIQLRLAHVA